MRIYLIKILFIVLFLGILGRLFYWQILRSEFLQAQAEGQRILDIKLGALRGNIFYSDGSLLASSNPVFRLFGLPKVISSDSKLELSYRLAKILAEDISALDPLAKDILSKLSEDLYWVLLEKNINSEQKSKIEQLNFSGIGFEQTSARFYPEGSASAHLLGFVGSDVKGSDVGYFGLEGYYEGELKGVAGQLKIERDALGAPILLGPLQTSDAKNGKDLILNIDRTIQFRVEEGLKRGLERYGAQGASAVVMDPKSGGVLAMASLPNYDPSKYFDSPKEYFKNPIVADQYEPGSTFKVLIMSAALNEDLVKVDTECDICSGPIHIGGFSIRTWNNKYFPQTSMKDTIIHSDNTGMVFVGQRLGINKLYEYLQNFGLGNTTNIDLQDEAFPSLKTKEDWSEIDLATASFGQGIAVTAIGMVTAVSAIANGGYLMEPHVVKFVRDKEDIFEIKPKVLRQVIKESTSKVMSEMMVAAVDEGEAKFAKPKGFRIAGKTGTAQIPVAGHYDPNKTIASFVGFAPADDPKFVMLIRYNQPSSSPYGSETAAPTFFEIAKELFTYYKIAPTE